jgi:CRP-like cAMP-binding protein
MPHKVVELDPRRPYREPGASRDEVLFVRDGILSKYKTDGSGRRQVVALRFPGEGILPREGAAGYGIQAIVPTELLVASSADFNALVEGEPGLQRFFWNLVQRNEAIGYEWLVNCGRRDSTARVAHLLLETAVRSGLDEHDARLSNPFTQQQIADITGQTSVNVNRVFADLERQGLIAREGRDILFKDWEELRRVASFQPGYLE